VCSSDTSAAVAVTVTNTNTWLGTTSTDWGTASNWSCGFVPVSTSEVVINSGTPNSPIVSDAGRMCNSLTIAVGATVTLNNAASQLSIFGAFTNNGTFNHTNGELIMAGTSAQTVPAGTYNKVNITNPSGISLSGNVTIADSLKLNGGMVVLGTNNLTLSGTSSVISGYNSSRYISTNGTGSLFIQNIGPGQRASNVEFPVGNGSYTPATLLNTGTVDQFSVRVMGLVYDNGLSGTVLTSNAVNRTWVINETVLGGSNANVTLQWNTGEQLTGFNNSLCYVAFHNTTSWLASGPAAATGSNPFTRSRSNLGLFNNTAFGVGSSGILPVNLIDLRAKRQHTQVRVEWSTASETNNDYFIVQRSIDGSVFESIGKVKGVGNSTSVSSYNFVDANAQQIAETNNSNTLYYRLIQMDIDGTSHVTDVVAVNLGTDNAASMKVQPNPFIDITNINIVSTKQENATMRILDMKGKLIVEKSIALMEGDNDFILDELAENTYSGVYFVTVSSSSGTMLIQKVVKTR
jgi:hypothetical protein